MSFTMYGKFEGYGGWQYSIIETCQKFYEKFRRYPDYVRMKEKTMEALFDENNRAFENPYDEEHAVRDSEGNLLIPLEVTEQNEYIKPKALKESDEKFIDEYINKQMNEETEEEDDDSWMDYGTEDENGETEDGLDYGSEDENEEMEDDGEDFYEEDEDSIWPMEFGVNDDNSVSFVTNKFELVFLWGEDLPDESYVVQFGLYNGDGGEDFDDEDENECIYLLKAA